MTFEQVDQCRKVFTQLLEFAKACDYKLATEGKGIVPDCEFGDILKVSESHLRLMQRLVSAAALHELTCMAQEDGLYE